MAVTDRNIVITPNRTATGKVQPKIVFTGADSSTGDSATITLFANPENSGTLSFSGTAGQLFSITNDLTGTIFSVNDVSGLPSLSINDQGVIQLAEFSGRVIIGDSIGSDDSASTLQVSGALTADSASFSKTTITNSGTIGTLSSNVASAAYLKITDGTNTLGFDGNEITQATSGSPGQLFLSANQVIIRPGNSGSDTVAQFNATGTTRLYHNKIQKFMTVDSGVTVTGSLRADSATISDGITAEHFNTLASTSADKFRYFGQAANYVSGFTNGYSYGGLSAGDGFAINWTMNNTAERGFIWKKTSHSGSQGAMSLTNTGRLTVAHSIRVGHGEGDTTAPGATHRLDVSGSLSADSATINGDVTLDSAGAILFDKSDKSLKFGDNYKAKFGPVASGGGLSITHTGSFGFVDTNFMQIRNNGGTKVAAQFFPTAAQILKHDGNTKFETTDSGINVFGNIRINNNPFPASAIATGTIDSARFPAALPAVSGANLTNLPEGGDGGIAMAIALG